MCAPASGSAGDVKLCVYFMAMLTSFYVTRRDVIRSTCELIMSNCLATSNGAVWAADYQSEISTPFSGAEDWTLLGSVWAERRLT